VVKIRVPFLGRKEGEPSQVSQEFEGLSGVQIPRTDTLTGDRTMLIATLAMSNTIDLKGKILEKLPGASDEDIKSITDEVIERRRSYGQ